MMRFKQTQFCTVMIVAFLACPLAGRADKDKHDKEKPEKEKKEKVESWVEVRTPNFVVASDSGEKSARKFAAQFEQLRHGIEGIMPNARVNLGFPIYVIAAHEGKSFAELFPEFPVDKRRGQPGGTFISGSEKNYIAVRGNASGPADLEEIYKEYARLIVKRSYHSLPPWLSEGYAGVLGSMTVSDKGASLGKPEPEDLSVLWESPLLPLDLILHVDRESAYYTNGDKTSVYFAESRALVHFLISDAQVSGNKPLDGYVRLVEGGMDALQAAKQSFGDLDQLQAKLEAYIKRTSSSASEVALPASAETASAPRVLSPAEAAARLGDFAIAHGQLERAQTKLEDAIKLDANLASAEESMGFLLLQQNQITEAQKHFERATQLDPKSSLAYYGSGTASLTSSGGVGIPVGAAAAFEKCVQINPDFAPAWFNLASLYAEHPETLPKALYAAQRASELTPGDTSYQLQLASVLDRMGRKNEAKTVAQQVRNSSSDSRAVDKAGDLLAQASSAKASQSSAEVAPAATASTAPDRTSPDRMPRIERKTEPEASATARPVAPKTSEKTSAAAPPVVDVPVSDPTVGASNNRVYSMVGTMSEISCAAAPQMKMTLKAQTLTMHLHADDLAHVTLKGSGAAMSKTVCTGLRGKIARISYRLAEDKPWDGEIESIEFRSE